VKMFLTCVIPVTFTRNCYDGDGKEATLQCIGDGSVRDGQSKSESEKEVGNLMRQANQWATPIIESHCMTTTVPVGVGTRD
jgi:hypothetical protein